MRHICAFDIYGTLFDMRTVLDALRGHSKDPERFYQLWRYKLVNYLWIVSAIDKFQDLTTLRERAFDFCRQEIEPELRPDVKQRFMEASLYLRPFADTREGLERLRAAGFKLVALSTGTRSDLTRMFERAGLGGHFDAIVTNQEAGIYKPHPRAYLHAADRLAVEPGQIRMVAAHPWDLIGAGNAGLAQAWLRRAELIGLESRTYDTISPEPELVADSFQALVERIIAADRP
ncbi:MAG: haloacid dehalogenase type II [Chloroflexi bacterium]|nr:haloacid dehalogenase type II [Chloroflexota bacterium]